MIRVVGQPGSGMPKKPKEGFPEEGVTKVLDAKGNPHKLSAL